MEVFTLWLWPLLAVATVALLLGSAASLIAPQGLRLLIDALVDSAQIAALGICVAIAFGAHPEHDLLPYVLSVVFTLMGAGLFAWTRFNHPRVPQESIIGIIYVVAAAAATLVLSRSAEGDEALKSLLVGNVLLVTEGEVLRTFALFVAIAIVHALLRERFLMVTFEEDEARARGIALRTWDFLFYATFGLTVVSFVQITGVYLVGLAPLGQARDARPADRPDDRLLLRRALDRVRDPDAAPVAGGRPRERTTLAKLTPSEDDDTRSA